MEVLALVILGISVLAGFISIFFTTFGTLIIFIGSLVYAALTGFAVINLKTIVVLFAFYLCGEVLEYICIIAGAKKFGASNVAVAGALIGGFAGALLGTAVLGIGIFLGVFVGIFLGAFLAEFIVQKDLVKSLKAGTGSILGRIGSIAAKLVIAIIMLVIMTLKIIEVKF
ncbi:MAG: DUF456 domain-containing protein [Candidatus Omnitrophota bacterium]|nr:MAG: DUF456 domain-containing protein [Candidatus Omnitrophota bacterium]